jgi:Protein of unknown function (DUF2889)
MTRRPSGFRRRILIEPGPGRVTAELEDDWHRMAVSLLHCEGIILDVAADMKRWPWSSCPGALERLSDTFTGVALKDVARRGEKTANCTHLYDLAVFAAAHAHDSDVATYDVHVFDPVDGISHAELRRGGVMLLEWILADHRFTMPLCLAGRRLTEIGDWIATLDPSMREAARVLRWTAIMAFGRTMDIPDGSSAAQFPTGACYTFQPDKAATAIRLPGAWVDFSDSSAGPMGDRSDRFTEKRITPETVTAKE